MDTPRRAYNEGRLEDTKRLLLAEYAEKPVVRLIQFDGHMVGGGDDVMHPDEDGHCLMAGETVELRNHSGSPYLPVRVEVYQGADKQEVLALLGKIANWVEQDWERLRGPDRAARRLEEALGPDGPPHLRRIK